MNELIIKNDDNEDIKCKVLFTYHSDIYLKDYIVYENDSNHEIYASIYNPSDSVIKDLQPIYSNEEYDMLDKMLEMLEIKKK